MRGFTIIEFMMVLAILGIVVASVYPHWDKLMDKVEEYEESRPVDCDEPTIENEGGLLCDRP